MTARVLPILTAVNDGYARPAAVMLFSLMSNLAPGYQVEVLIMTTSLAPESRDSIKQAVRRFPVTIKFLEVSDSRLNGLKLDGHVSIETYLRILAADLLGDLDKVLYLDCDLLVRHSVHPLFEVDATNVHLLAAPNLSPASGSFGSPRGVPSFSLLGIAPETPTFNAGVMVLNLRRWRETRAADQIFAYLRDYRQHVLWWDQDGLNAVLYQSWAPLVGKWNFMTNHWGNFTSWRDSLLDEVAFAATRGDPAIIHYSSTEKPWMHGYDGLFAKDWSQAFLQLQLSSGHPAAVCASQA